MGTTRNDTNLHVEPGREVGHGRRGDDAEAQHVRPCGADAGGERRLEEVSGDPRIASDGEAAAAARGHHTHRRPRQTVHQLDGEVPVRDAADAVSAE